MLNLGIKKLDLLVIKAFIGPFIAIFFVTAFVLDLQFFWLYIDDVVGKGIDALTVWQLIMYLSATVVPLALPLAVLLSSIMTLGNLGETFELVAIKSAGISLLRFMRPLGVVAFFLAIIAFFFNNNVLPLATTELNTLKYDIIYTKPAFDIREGVFYDRIEGFVIKIGHKDKNDSTIRDVVIYEQAGTADNVIIADSGKMVVSPDKHSLVFTLRAGSRYQEKTTGGVYNSQLVRMSFDTYKKVMDLTSFQMNRTNDSNFRGNFQGQTIFQLGHSIDSIHKANNNFIVRSAKLVNANLKFSDWLDTTGWDKTEKDTAYSHYLLPTKYVTDSIHRVWATAHRQRDSIDKAEAARDKAVADAGKKAAAEAAKKAADSAKKGPPSKSTSPDHTTSTTVGGAVFNTPAGGVKPAVRPVTPVPGGQAVNRIAVLKEAPKPTFGDLLPDSVRVNVLDRANSALNNARVSVDQPIQLFNNEQDNLRQHEIAWHEKITLAVAVLVMFLIGAPLGSIIRKGGIGLPLVFAVIFFVIFFLLNNFGRKFVKEGVMGPIGGMWMATYVLTPIGIFLTYKAMHDSNLFNKEFYFRLRRGIAKTFQKLRRRRKEESTAS